MILNINGYITGNEIARFYNITIRTVRKDMKEINNILKRYGLEISSDTKNGYFLNNKSKESLKEINLIREVIDYEYIKEKPNAPIDRQVYILLKLMVENNILIEYFVESLYVSEATINNDVTVINKWLKKNLNTSISYSLKEGLTLSVSEKEKRNIISWIFGGRLNISTVAKNWNYLFGNIISTIEIMDIYGIVSEKTRKHNYYLSGHCSQFFCYQILIAINRQKEGFYIEDSDTLDKELMTVIQEIRIDIGKKYEIKASDIEWFNLQQYFQSMQLLHGTDIKNIETEDIDNIVDEFINVINTKFKIDLRQKADIKYKLILYIVPMINRLKYNHCIPNKIDKKVVQNYNTEFEMASEMIPIIKNRLDLNMKMIDLAYITMYFVSICEMWKCRLNTIIVCDYDESILSLIKSKINTYFGERISVCRFYNYQEFMYESSDKLQQIDFIITTSTIADITKIPFVHINYEFNSNDIQMVSKFLNNFT